MNSLSSYIYISVSDMKPHERPRINLTSLDKNVSLNIQPINSKNHPYRSMGFNVESLTHTLSFINHRRIPRLVKSRFQHLTLCFFYASHTRIRSILRYYIILWILQFFSRVLMERKALFPNRLYMIYIYRHLNKQEYPNYSHCEKSHNAVMHFRT